MNPHDAVSANDPAELFIVGDALEDPRFADNPTVTVDPNVRF